VTTIHGFSSERILPAFKAYDDRVHYVAISDADRHSDLRYAATIHHGIRLEDFPFDPHGSEDLLFFGRIHPDKGRPRRLRWHVERVVGWSWPASSRIRTIITSKSHPRSTTVPWSIAARWAGGAHESPGFRARAAPPHQLRRAVRTIGRGGARLRHAGHRLQPRVDARADRPRRDRLPGRQRGCSRGCDRPYRRNRSHRLPVGGVHALHVDRMADRYLDLYRSLLG